MVKNNKSENKMYYRMLGNTGLQVSVLSFGFWATYGVKDGLTHDEGAPFIWSEYLILKFL